MSNEQFFKQTFGFYPEELYTMPKDDFFKWLIADAPTQRKKGKWILTEDDEYEYCVCSECGYENGENWMNGRDIPFCSNCGADMRGEQDDEQRSN